VLTTPLHQFHLDHGAQMVDFAGWEMPIRYTGIVEEHHQVRRSGGMFDVSHMGRVEFSGRHARRLLERACSRAIHSMQPGQCRYCFVCNERGGVRDDVIVMRRDEDQFTVVVNGANRSKMLDHFESVRAGGDLACSIKDTTEDTAMIAIQGPEVMGFISKFSGEIPSLKRFRFAVKNLLVVKLMVSRTGYTGEDGVEIILPGKSVPMALKMLLAGTDVDAPDAAIKPIGLGARDTLRLEAGLPLYGNDLGEDISALSSGMDFAISLDKDSEPDVDPFIGADALKRERDAGGPTQKLVGLALEGRRTARKAMGVLVDGRAVGRVTSGCMSPTLGHPIAMGLLDAEHAVPGVEVAVDAGRGTIQGRVVQLPFYKPSS